jgi:hypothetical protein
MTTHTRKLNPHGFDDPRDPVRDHAGTGASQPDDARGLPVLITSSVELFQSWMY